MKRDCPHLDRAEAILNRKAKQEERSLRDTRHVSKDLTVTRRGLPFLKRLARRAERFARRQFDRSEIVHVFCDMKEKFNDRHHERNLTHQAQKRADSSPLISRRVLITPRVSMVPA